MGKPRAIQIEIIIYSICVWYCEHFLCFTSRVYKYKGFFWLIPMPGQVWSCIFYCGSTSSTNCSNCYTWNWNPWGPNNWWVMQGMHPFCNRLVWFDKVFITLPLFHFLNTFWNMYRDLGWRWKHKFQINSIIKVTWVLNIVAAHILTPYEFEIALFWVTHKVFSETGVGELLLYSLKYVDYKWKCSYVTNCTFSDVAKSEIWFSNDSAVGHITTNSNYDELCSVIIKYQLCLSALDNCKWHHYWVLYIRRENHGTIIFSLLCILQFWFQYVIDYLPQTL